MFRRFLYVFCISLGLSAFGGEPMFKIQPPYLHTILEIELYFCEDAGWIAYDEMGLHYCVVGPALFGISKNTQLIEFLRFYDVTVTLLDGVYLVNETLKERIID